MTHAQYTALWRCLMIAAVLVVLMVLVLTGAL
jgi:hypothetical protein